MTHLARPGVLWLALSAMLMAGALVAWAAPAAALDWQPQHAATQPWRWWSAAFVHGTPAHLAANLFAAGLVAAYGWAGGVPRRIALAWFVAWPLTHLALLQRPELLHYGGLSGVLHAGVAATSVWLLWYGQGRQRVIGLLVLCGQSLKLLFEQPWGATLHVPGELGVAIAPLAHACGSLAGAMLAVLVLLPRRAA